MSYQIDQSNGDLIINGWEKGMAPSPHQGIGMLKCANIYTESGEVMANYGRKQVNFSQTGTLAYQDSSRLTISTLTPNVQPLIGTWILVSASSNGGQLANGYYQIVSNSSGTIQLSVNYRGVALGTYGSGLTASFSIVTMQTPIPNQSPVEQYIDSNNNTQYRYYIGEQSGRLWVLDTGYANSGWSIATNGTDITTSYATSTGLTVLNGYVLLFSGNSIYYKSTVRLDVTWATMTSALNGVSSTTNHYAIVNHNNFCFYCDGNIIGQITCSSVSSAGNVNLQSYGIFTSDGASPSNLSITTLFSGNFPPVGATITFFTSIGGSLTNVSVNTVYYIKAVNRSSNSFTVSSTVGGTEINSISGTGTLYFNTFNPNSATSATFTINYISLQLNTTDISQSLCELGTNLFIGCQSNVIYNWNEIAVASNGSLSVIQLPESNTVNIVQANNVAYCFSGSKGNIYVTSGSAVSLAITIPDYAAGIPSATTPLYIEPYFVWGASNYMRGKIYFSLQDQTSVKTGNCGAIWSFVPSFFNPVTGQDLGTQLHIENQNSYNTYNGMAVVIQPFINQVGLGAQYYTAWTSDQNSGSATYGIDATNTIPVNTNGLISSGSQVVIETDFVPTGTILGQQLQTYGSLEFKLATPLVAGETITVGYRINTTTTFTSLGNQDLTQLTTGLYTGLSFEKTQWIQFQILMSSTNLSPSFCRLYDLRLRK